MKKLFLLICAFSAIFTGFAQQNEGQLHGNFQMDMQSYAEDTLIGASKAPEIALMNSYANFNYTKGKFSAGVRYEGYLNTLQGYMNEGKRNDKVGFPYKYATYASDELEVTVGNYYDQFGNGLIFRSYEDKLLGYDNAMQGVRIRYNPFKGLTLKGIVGQQRYYFDYTGLVRGIDGELVLNELEALSKMKPYLILGGSFISKYQEDKDPVYILPENVAAMAGRMNLYWGKFSLSSEYAYKINDPSTENGLIYKPGNAILVNATFSQKGLGVFASFKRVDNMGFRSDRTATLNNLIINNLPVVTKNHTYALMAFYPYATQTNGEVGGQLEVMYKFKKGTLLGGKYGTNLSVNFSQVNGLIKTQPNDSTAIGTPGTLGYITEPYSTGDSLGNSPFHLGDELFFNDINVEISKKINKKLKLKYNFMYFDYNQGIIEGHGDMVHGNVNVLDITYKLMPKHALRLEMQHMYTKQDKGNWAMGLLEYSVSPSWFFTIIDQYNYGNSDEAHQTHYYKAAIGYTKKANRIQIGYGKQREGILCVGGVCRAVPAANGFTISITSSF